MTNYSTLFADISSNNSGFDAKAYRDAGHMLIAIKATEGLNYTNPEHRTWCLHAGLNWISVVHYHFARPDQGNAPEAEADHFLNVALPLAGWWDYLCVDVERATPEGWQHDPAWSAAFDAQIQRRTRFHTIIYANKSTLEASDRWLVGETRRVWDADWSTDPGFAPAGYECCFRQFTDGTLGPFPHTLPGVGQGDVNRMNSIMFGKLSQRYRA